MNLKSFVKLSAQYLTDLVYPPSCLVCGTSLLWDNNRVVCGDCADRLETIRLESCWYCSTPLGMYAARQKVCDECRGNNLSFTRVAAACQYNSAAREVIHSFKFDNQKHISKFISKFIIDKFREEYADIRFDYVLPVPLHKNKYYQRGYNQSELLARELAESEQLTFSNDIISRERHTVSQFMLNSEDRGRNLSGAFDVSKQLSNSTILLVDDVFTTGSTISECAYTLRQYGARRVYAIVFAR